MNRRFTAILSAIASSNGYLALEELKNMLKEAGITVTNLISFDRTFAIPLPKRTTKTDVHIKDINTKRKGKLQLQIKHLANGQVAFSIMCKDDAFLKAFSDHSVPIDRFFLIGSRTEINIEKDKDILPKIPRPAVPTLWLSTRMVQIALISLLFFICIGVWALVMIMSYF